MRNDRILIHKIDILLSRHAIRPKHRGYISMAMTVFKKMLGDIVEHYVNALEVKSHLVIDQLKHLGIICKLKINPLKCAFEITSGKFLGLIACHRWLKVKTPKINAIIKLQDLKNI